MKPKNAALLALLGLAGAASAQQEAYAPETSRLLEQLEQVFPKEKQERTRRAWERKLNEVYEAKGLTGLEDFVEEKEDIIEGKSRVQRVFFDQLIEQGHERIAEYKNATPPRFALKEPERDENFYDRFVLRPNTSSGERGIDALIADLNKHPTARGYLRLSSLALDAKNPSLGLKAANSARMLDGNMASAYTNASAALASLNRYEDAINAAQRGLQFAEGRDRAILYMGAAGSAFRLGRTQDALGWADQGVMVYHKLGLDHDKTYKILSGMKLHALKSLASKSD